MSYATIPASGSGTTVSTSSPLSGDGSGGSPVALSPASALTPGSLSIADFNKLATVPTGSGIAISYMTSPIDLTATGVTNVLVAMPYRFGRLTALVPLSWYIEATAGTLSGDGTFSFGSNGAAFTNLFASQATPAALRTQAAKTYVAIGTPVSPFSAVDLTASGLNLNVTGGVTGGGTLSVRLQISGLLIPV